MTCALSQDPFGIKCRHDCMCHTFTPCRSHAGLLVGGRPLWAQRMGVGERGGGGGGGAAPGRGGAVV